MARNADGTVVLKTTGKLARTPRGSGMGKVVTTAFLGAGSGAGGGLTSYRRGWRVVGKSER